MQPGQPFKTCRKCGAAHPLQAQFCQCGHVFTTQFPDPNQQTTMFVPPQNIQNPQPYAQTHQQLPLPRDAIQLYPGTHQTIIAILLSLFLPGLGQIYNKQTTKGLVLLGLTFLGVCLIVCSYGILNVIVWIIALVDAILIAGKLNKGQPVMQNEWF
jgi:TM2 domain-containing membrane protein YozV